MEAQSPASKYLTELVAKFPDAPALTLAKTAYRECPEYWNTLEVCRSAVRRLLGVAGKEKREGMKDKRFIREPRKAGWTDVIPEALIQLPDWKAFEIPGPHRALILSDVHIPFHHIGALEQALQYGLDNKTTLILLNGDIVDHYSLSKWVTDPKLRDFPGEVRSARHFLKGLRKRFPKTRIVYRHGNHEDRLETFLRFKAPELLGLPNIEWSEIFGLDEWNIELIKQKRPIRLGELNVLHGHEHRYAISNPVNPARGLFLRAKDHALCGHFHQASQHSDTTVRGKVISTWSTGCLCDLNPEYSPINNWCLGFAFVSIDSDGGFHVDNKRIIGGQVY